MAELLKGKALFPGNDCILNIKLKMQLKKILSTCSFFFLLRT